MGRNKAKLGALTKHEKKLQKEGILQRNWDPSGKNLTHSAPNFDPGQHSRTRRGSHGQDTYRFWEAVALGAVPVTLRGPLDGLYSQVPCVLVDDWRPITPADLVAWRQNLTERFGDLNAATRTARRTVLNSTYWAEQIRSMA